MQEQHTPVRNDKMYLFTDYVREEFHGSVADSPSVSVEEGFEGEAYSLFLEHTIHEEFSPSLYVADDISGEKIEIEASDHLTDEEIDFLKSMDKGLSLVANATTVCDLSFTRA